ncbi:hypothetical protein ACTXT7_014480 [Hymenolepis weldensis]
MRRFVRLDGIVYPNVMATKHYDDMRLYFVSKQEKETSKHKGTVQMNEGREEGSEISQRIKNVQFIDLPK